MNWASILKACLDQCYLGWGSGSRKTGNPGKSWSLEIPKIRIPKVGIPGQFSGLIPKILNFQEIFRIHQYFGNPVWEFPKILFLDFSGIRNSQKWNVPFPNLLIIFILSFEKLNFCKLLMPLKLYLKQKKNFFLLHH